MDATVYTEMLQNLELDLERLTEIFFDVFTHVKKAIGLCIVAYRDLQIFVIKEGFENTEKEIVFFKKIKPLVTSKLTFFRRLEKIERLWLVCTIENQILYLDDEIQKLRRIKMRRDLDLGIENYKPINTWNGNHASFIESIYGIKAARDIDNGRISIKDLVELFRKVLILSEIDIYGTFNSIKNRKKNRPIFF